MVLSKLFERRSGLANPDKWLLELLGGGGATSAGVNINPKSGMGVADVYACVKVIAETVGVLHLHLYRRLEKGKDRVRDNPTAKLISEHPNKDMTATTFWQAIVGNAASWGNGYAVIQPAASGYADSMTIMTPDRVRIERVWRTGEIIYWFTADGFAPIPLKPSEVFHIPGFGFDGLRGYSPITLHRQIIGLEMAAIEHTAGFYGRGANPSGVLEYPHQAKDVEKLKKFRDDFDKLYAGYGNSHRTAILTQGMKYTPIMVSAKDARTVELLKLTTVQIAKLFRMKLHKIEEMDRATFTNIEHQAIEFVQDTIMPWLERIAQEVKRKLIRPSETDLFAEHKIEGLLRGDIKTRYEAHAIAIRNGWRSPNDVREIERENPIPGGHVYVMQGQMESVESIAEPDKSDDTGNQGKNTDGTFAGSGNGDDERMARVADNYRGLFEDAYGRILRVEMDKLKRASKKDGFTEWVEGFYVEHKQHVRLVMGAVVDACGGALYSMCVGRPACKETLRLLRDYTAGLADRHAQLGYQAAYQAGSRGGTVREALDAVCAGWKDRPAALAKQEVRLLTAAVTKMVELN